MINTDIYIEVMRRLRDDTTLKSYVRNVIDGNKNVVLDNEMPAILVDVLPSEEIYADMPNRKQNLMRFAIRGIFDIRHRLDCQNLNYGSEVGSLQFEADIKNALEKPNLSYANSAYYPKMRTLVNENLGDVSRHIIIELEVDGKYFLTGNR